MLRAAVLCFVASACVIPASAPPHGYAGNGYAPQSTCVLGSNGVQACGYDCKVGADGIAACAAAPGGQCALGSDGHVYCSQRPVDQAYGAQPAACQLNSDGSQSCGYNCQLGSDGHHYCASTPNGRCALNSDGSWSCP